MTNFVKKAILATALSASLVGGLTATPAMAHPYGGRGWGGGGAGAAVAGGIIGLAVGAAIASDRPYYPAYPAPAYYAPPVQGYYQAPVMPVAYVNPAWVWRDGFFWDGYGHRYYRDGRPFGYGGAYYGGYRGGYAGGYHGGYAGGYHGGGHGGHR